MLPSVLPIDAVLVEVVDVLHPFWTVSDFEIGVVGYSFWVHAHPVASAHGLVDLAVIFLGRVVGGVVDVVHALGAGHEGLTVAVAVVLLLTSAGLILLHAFGLLNS